MPTPITRFKCNYCKTHYSCNKDVLKHEKRCFCNPDNKSCSTCSFSHPGISWCDKLEENIYVPGSPIRDCLDWEEIECIEDQGCYED
jgi:hypothetical protein